VRINDPPPTNVERPEARAPLGAIAAVRAVSPQSPAPAAPRGVPTERAETAAAPTPAAAPVERRQGDRRGEDRRKEQRNVTLDTRVGPRRLTRRRAEDSAPPSIDVEA